MSLPEPLVIPLWPPAANPVMRVHLPSSLPAGASVPAILVLSGGGFFTCAGSGGETPAWAASKGMVGIDVEYACVNGGQKGPGPNPARVRGEIIRPHALAPMPDGGRCFPQCMYDASRAVRLVRKLAADGELPVDPTRVIVCGYSSGGTVASLLATRWDQSYMAPEADDLRSTISCRPDRVALCYSVNSCLPEADTLMKADGSATTLAFSLHNLLGDEDKDEQMQRELSATLHARESSPPLFIWTTEEDEIVPAAHSVLMHRAALDANGQSVLHVFKNDPNVALHGYSHGQGLALDNPVLGGWSEEMLEWLSG